MSARPPADAPGVDDDAIAVLVEPGAARVILRGDIDLAVAVRLGIELRRVFVDGHIEVEIDLAAVTFMDSSALGVLVGAQRQARIFRGSLLLVGPSASVRRLLALTAMDKVLDVREASG
ncbi:STAS domain-containing protein [Nocardioides sp. C4-1]|uniref:STAS domain-containing protein n=1 Tax=Nocardioides sp. C4-1 TaxID=3151851 RepID=UPI003267AE08